MAAWAHRLYKTYIGPWSYHKKQEVTKTGGKIAGNGSNFVLDSDIHLNSFSYIQDCITRNLKIPEPTKNTQKPAGNAQKRLNHPKLLEIWKLTEIANQVYGIQDDS